MGERARPDSLSAKHIHFHLEELNNLPHRIHSINLSIVNNNGLELRRCGKKNGGWGGRWEDVVPSWLWVQMMILFTMVPVSKATKARVWKKGHFSFTLPYFGAPLKVLGLKYKLNDLWLFRKCSYLGQMAWHQEQTVVLVKCSASQNGNMRAIRIVL